MCLAIPGEVILIEGVFAWVNIMGVRQKVNIQLIEELKEDDFILVHAGFAIEKIKKEYYSFLEQTLKEMMDNE